MGLLPMPLLLRPLMLRVLCIHTRSIREVEECQDDPSPMQGQLSLLR